MVQYRLGTSFESAGVIFLVVFFPVQKSGKILLGMLFFCNVCGLFGLQ